MNNSDDDYFVTKNSSNSDNQWQHIGVHTIDDN